jgi:hypothetical protein
MRREGYEFAVSKAEVLYHTDERGKKLEPMELAYIDVPDEFTGSVIQKLSQRKGELLGMTPINGGYTRLQFSIPSRGLIGYRHEGVKNKLVLSIFVRELRFIEDDEVPEEQSKSNQIFLDGYVCKPPIYRKTPLGREIADILVAVNRPYGKSDYIPCIAWGRNARFAGGLEVGSHLQICGRVQSREYTKKIGEEEVEKRVAYEVSVSKIDLVEDEE